MHYEELAPPAELGGLVHRLWVLRGRMSPGGPFQRAMPDGRAELIFNFGDPFECLDGETRRIQPLSLLLGPSRRAMAIRPTGAVVDLIGVRFRPEALAGWLRVRGPDLCGAAFALADLPSPLERTLHEQLADARGRGRLALLARHLARTAGHQEDRRLAAAVDVLLRDSGAHAAGAARTVGLSRRQLDRLCRERIGLGPKSLGRLGRFQRALRSLEGGSRASLAASAALAGYFDQAHMTREFRLFAGTTPRRHLHETRELTRHFLDSSA